MKSRITYTIAISILISILLASCSDTPTGPNTNEDGVVIKSSYQWCAEDNTITQGNNHYDDYNNSILDCSDEVTAEEYYKNISHECWYGGECNPYGIDY